MATFTVRVVGNHEDHIESITLNGEPMPYDTATTLTYEGAGTTNKVVVTFKAGVVVDDFTQFQVYDRTTSMWLKAGFLDEDNVYTADFNSAAYYAGTARAIEFFTYQEPVDVDSPFNKLFYMDKEKLVELSEVMPEVYGTGNSSSPLEIRDQSGYMINMLMLPFELPSDVISTDGRVVIGTQDSGVLAPIISDDSIEINLGDIVVTDLSNNALDYVAATYELVFPFSDKTVMLDPYEVVGKTISVKYLLDPYTGDISINVYNGSDVPIHSLADRIGREIPFKLFNDPIQRMGAPISLNNELLTPVIRVAREELTTGTWDNLVTINGVLSGQTGYFKILECDIKNVPNSNRLLELLREGIIIK